MAVEAIFTDIDGTLIPPSIKRDEARLDPRLKKILSDLSASGIKLAAVTTKDYSFASRILPFADAWATVGGLEIKTADGKNSIHQGVFEKQAALTQVLRLAEAKAAYVEAVIEHKLLSDNNTLAGFCFDWRFSPKREDAQRAAEEIYSRARAENLHPILYSHRPYLDIYTAEVDKGYAVEALKKMLNIRGKVVYFGDSEVDNPAFAKADISIGIIHEETPGNIEADHKIPFGTLTDLLETLLLEGEEKFLLKLVRT